MTRGKIIFVDKNKCVYSTIEFNGDMYPFDGGHGEEIVDFFQRCGFRDFHSYESYVKRFDERNFGYSFAYDEELVRFKGSCNVDSFDFSDNYTDYLYLINHSGMDVCMKVEEGEKMLPDGAMAIVHFQNLREILPEVDEGIPDRNKMTEWMETMDWDLFAQQKEWLCSQRMQIEKWYGCEAAALPTGILNMMDRIQDAWETACGDASRCWYEERWYDEDLEEALEAAGVMVTEANVAGLKERCRDIFNDKSARNEMLVNMAREQPVIS